MQTIKKNYLILIKNTDMQPIIEQGKGELKNVYTFDLSTIDLCLSVFWWATFRKTNN